MGYVVSGEGRGWDDGRVVLCKSGIFHSTERLKSRYSSISREGMFPGLTILDRSVYCCIIALIE